MRYVWQALHGRPDRWIAAGAALGFGLLGKLYTVFLGIGVFIYLVVCARPWLRRRGPYIAAAIALIMLSPVIYWNIVHDWAGVRFQVQERLHEEGEPGNMPGPGAGTRLAEQHLSLVLILFPAFAWGLWVAWRRRGDERFAYLLCTSVPALVMPLLVAPVGAARGHLMAPAYIGLAVALGALWNRPVAWLAAGNAVVLLLFVAAVLAPALLPIPGAREYYGWREAGARAMQEVAALGPATKAVIVADRYQIAAQMTYYTRDAVPVLFMPHANPASVWPSVDRYRGATAVAVTYAPDGFEWRGCFSRVEHRPTVTVRHGSRTVQEFYVFRLSGLSLPCPRR
jgi:4-amino-4-deoxy-L-arabinose transferase-like glycosyltransferase